MVHHLRIAGRIDAVSRGTPTDVHIFHATEEQRQLSDMANQGVEVIAETLCGEMVDVQHGVGRDNKTLRTSEMHKRLCRACQEIHAGPSESVSLGTSNL